MSIQTENRLALLETLLQDISKRVSALEENQAQGGTLKALRDDIQGLKMRMGKRETGLA